MKCARCSAEVPAQSQFCLRCGTPLHTTALPPNMAPAAQAFSMPRQNNRPTIAIITVLVLAVVALAGFLIKGALTQQTGKSPGGQLVQKPGEGGSGALVQAPGDSHAGAPVQAPADANPNKITQQPAPVSTVEINDYLRFVKGIESRKQQATQDIDAKLKSIILGTTVGGMKEGLRGTENSGPSGDPSMRNITPSGTNDLAKNIEAQFNQLTTEFRQRQPPPSCIELRDRYYDHLGKLQANLAKMAGIFADIQAGANGDLYEKVNRMQGQSGAIDESADSAQRAHVEICKKYNLEMDFEIRGDQREMGFKGFNP